MLVVLFRGGTGVLFLFLVEQNVLARSLLYTAATRARRAVVLVSSEAALRFAIATTKQGQTAPALDLLDKVEADQGGIAQDGLVLVDGRMEATNDNVQLLTMRCTMLGAHFKTFKEGARVREHVAIDGDPYDRMQRIQSS